MLHYARVGIYLVPGTPFLTRLACMYVTSDKLNRILIFVGSYTVVYLCRKHSCRV